MNQHEEMEYHKKTNGKYFVYGMVCLVLGSLTFWTLVGLLFFPIGAYYLSKWYKHGQEYNRLKEELDGS